MALSVSLELLARILQCKRIEEIARHVGLNHCGIIVPSDGGALRLHVYGLRFGIYVGEVCFSLADPHLK